MGVSQGLMTRALAQATGMDEADPRPSPDGRLGPRAHQLRRADRRTTARATARGPIPSPSPRRWKTRPKASAPPEDWLAEWKWDGIRGQLIARRGAFALWSRGEELITDRFPEFAPLADFLPPGTVIDGEVLAWERRHRPLPFAALQKRIGRKTVPKKLLAEAPARMLAYDLLEDGGEDLRAHPLAERRARLDAIIAALPPGLPLDLSPAVPFARLGRAGRDRAPARATRGAEGLMLKRAASAYHVGRKRGDWWKWKLDPWTRRCRDDLRAGRPRAAGEPLHRFHLRACGTATSSCPSPRPIPA